MGSIRTYEGSRSGIQSTQKDKCKGIVGMFRIYSQIYDNPDAATI